MLDAAPKKKRSLAMIAPTPVSPLDRISAELQALDVDRAIDLFAARSVDRALKTTISLCPVCLAYVPALVFERAGRVIIAKRCADHGTSEALLENNARFYALSNKDRSGRRFADDRVFHIPAFIPGDGAGACCAPGETCGDASTDQLANRTCTVLVEVTDACNLACPICYSDAKGDRKLPREAQRPIIDELLGRMGLQHASDQYPSQLSGGMQQRCTNKSAAAAITRRCDNCAG